MTGAPVIGLTTYPPDKAGWFRLPADYVNAVRRAGGLPWLIPPGEARLAELLEQVDALVLTGGGDVDPGLYGGRANAQIYSVDRTRDEGEIRLARAALEHALPTLGICRGCQVVNVALGGTLIEHLPDEPPSIGERVPHRGEGPGTSILHAVELAGDSRVAAIVGDSRPRTSSSHHQAIRRVADGLRVVARASDGTIEAVELTDGARHPFFVAVQWHPEETAASDPGQQRLFDALAAAARERRKARG